MIKNVGSNPAAPCNGNARVLGNRPARLNLPTNFSTPRTGVEVKISDEAQRLFMNMQEGYRDLAAWLTEFIEKEAASLTPISSDFFSSENAETAEMGIRLLSAINLDRNDVDNFASLGNRYAEMRQALEATYYGEELEAQLNKLSEAFDLTAQILGHERATTAFLQMRFEQARMVVHNQLLNQNTTFRFFNDEHVEYDEEKLSNIFSVVTNGIRESIRHFARLTRQFVLENGSVTTAQDHKVLEAFLQSAEPSAKGFTLNDLNSITEILQNGSATGNGSTTPTPVAMRNETMFSELLRRFPNLVS
ncbi:MAG: hypothetical protein FWF79_03860 [Defluviitaleaceae bacterium]|nr:hypothetical protein [Defluviitaleaceae bacterium]